METSNSQLACTRAMHWLHLNQRPTEGSGLNFVFAECLGKLADSLVFTGKRANPALILKAEQKFSYLC